MNKDLIKDPSCLYMKMKGKDDYEKVDDQLTRSLFIEDRLIQKVDCLQLEQQTLKLFVTEPSS